MECPMLYKKTLSNKPINYPGPCCKNHPDFSHCLLLQFINCPLNKDQGFCAIWPEPTTLSCGVSSCLHFPFPFNKTLLLLCNLCLCSRDVRTWDLLNQDFWDHPLVTWRPRENVTWRQVIGMMNLQVKEHLLLSEAGREFWNSSFSSVFWGPLDFMLLVSRTMRQQVSVV
jgi:hypothetical protein